MTLLGRISGSLRRLGGEQRAKAADGGLLWMLEAEGICVSVGGGPIRVAKKVRTLNIEPLQNVDIVGDAHELPFRDSSVGAIHCEAVLEHLGDPQRAVREMMRVLRPGGRLFAVTPFLQVFHGYPDHFQNYTLSGHRRLFESAGFVVVNAGSAVGPSFAAADILSNYFVEVFPRGAIGRAFGAFAWLAFLPLRLRDRRFMSRTTALASTTFVQAMKP